MTYFEEAAVFDLIVRTVGEEAFMNSCGGEIFSSCVG